VGSVKLPNAKSLLLCVFVVLVSTAFANVHAQTTTISELQYQNQVVAGRLDPLVVRATVTYAESKPGYFLAVGIVDEGFAPPKAVLGIVSSSPDICVNQQMLQALCIIRLPSSSGTEHLEFKIGGILEERRTPNDWHLNMMAVLLNSNNTVIEGSRSSHPFTITFAQIVLTVTVPAAVSVTVDGVKQPSGEIAFPVSAGEHSLELPALVEVDNMTRLKFDSWSDGLTLANRTIWLNSSESVEATYATQYRLVLTGGPVTAVGEGWYDQGSPAAFSVPASGSISGLLGLLGGKASFQGWYENGELVTDSPTGTISMSRPHTLVAQWQIDYSMPISIIAGIAIVVSLVYLVTRRRSKRSVV